MLGTDKVKTQCHNSGFLQNFRSPYSAVPESCFILTMIMGQRIDLLCAFADIWVPGNWLALQSTHFSL